MQIFKLIRPTNDDVKDIGLLLFNQDKSILTRIRMSKDGIEGLFGDKYKVYIMGDLSETGSFYMGEKVEDQPW